MIFSDYYIFWHGPKRGNDASIPRSGAGVQFRGARGAAEVLTNVMPCTCALDAGELPPMAFPHWSVGARAGLSNHAHLCSAILVISGGFMYIHLFCNV